MATSEVITLDDAETALLVYYDMPGATTFRANTGMGFIVDGSTEKIGLIRGARVWKPMYFNISGASSVRGKKLTAAAIDAVVKEFVAHPLWALLRVNTRRGLAVVDGMPTLVEGRQVRSATSLEITHYGGRSIVPALETMLGRVEVLPVEWKSGFTYQTEENKVPRRGRELQISRVMAETDWASDEALERVWLDIQREALRLGMMNTDGGLLDRVFVGSTGEAHAFLTQELSALLPNTQIDREPGYSYDDRGDVVVVRTNVQPADILDEAAFYSMIEAFKKECMRVYMLYCRPLSDAQKATLGRPTMDEQSGELVSVGKVSFQRDELRTTAQQEQLIAWSASSRRPHFANEGWAPEKGKNYRVFCFRWGAGIRVSPAAPVYLERYVAKDEETAVRQQIRVEYDGTEKVLSETEIKLKEERVWDQSTSWSPKLVETVEGWWIVETLTSYDRLFREQVTETYDTDVNGKKVTRIERRMVSSDPYETQRRYMPSRMWAEMRSWHSGDPSQDDLGTIDLKTYYTGFRVRATAINADGKEVTAGIWDNQRGDMLSWNQVLPGLRLDYEVRWPVCECGRMRREALKHERCYKCRAYRPCSRCGKETYVGEDKPQDMIVLCSNCKITADRVARVRVYFTVEVCQRIAAEAQSLLAGQLTEGPAAIALLTEVIERRFQPGYERDRKIGELNGILLAIVNSDGYWSSKKNRQALEMLATIDQQENEEFLLTVALAVFEDVEAFLRGDHDLSYYLGTSYDYAIAAAARATSPQLAKLVADSETSQGNTEKAVATAEAALAAFAVTANAELPEADPQVQAVKKARQLFAAGKNVEAIEAAKLAQQLCEEAMAQVNEGAMFYFAEECQRVGNNDREWVWVIDAEGNCIDPDPISWKRGVKDQVGTLTWAFIPADALVLYWGRNQDGGLLIERWEVVKLPKGGITIDQLKAAGEVEPHERFRGTWTGFDFDREAEVVIEVGRNSFSMARRSVYIGDHQQGRTQTFTCEVYDWDAVPVRLRFDGGWGRTK